MRLLKPADRQVFAIAVPAFWALVTEPLMLLADTAIVGRLGTPELASLAVAAVVLSTVVGLCVFLAYGTTAAVARAQGSSRPDLAAEASVGGIWLAVGLGVALAGLIAATATVTTSALASSTDVAGYARSYLLVSSLGLPGMLVMLAATGALRGSLDLRTPVQVAIISNLFNAGLSLALVHGAGLGVAGAALGTVIAQTAGAGWLTWAVIRPRPRSGHRNAAQLSLRPQLAPVIQAARRGLPLLARTATLRVTLIVAVAVAAGLGDAPLAAHQIAVAVVSLLAFGLDALAIAGQTLTGRSLGAGDLAQTRALTRRMMAWGAGGGLVAGIGLAISAPWVIAGLSPDAAVAKALLPALLMVAAIQPASGVVFVLDGVLIGAGDGSYLALAGVATLAAYLPAAWWVAHSGAGLGWLWLAYAGYIAARLVTLVARERGDRWLITGS